MESRKADDLRALIEPIATISLEDALSPAGLGNFNFKQAQPSLGSIKIFANLLLRANLTLLPERIGDALFNHFSELKNRLVSISAFTVESTANPQAARTEIVESINQTNERVILDASPFCFVSILGSNETSTLQSQLLAATEEALQVLNESRQRAMKVEAELDKTVAAVKEAAGKTGVQHHGSDFAKQAAQHEKAAKNWLKVTVVLSISTLAIALLAFWYHPDLTTPLEILNWITTKLVVLAILTTGTLWCGRLYKSEKHQQAVSTHRHHALATFETFVAASRDDTTKDAVLLAATQSIFALASPGYLGGDDMGSDSSLKIIELIKGVSALPRP